MRLHAPHDFAPDLVIADRRQVRTPVRKEAGCDANSARPAMIPFHHTDR
jgi:hypothetical protein